MRAILGVGALLCAASFASAGAPVKLVCTPQSKGGTERWLVDAEARTVSYGQDAPANLPSTITVVDVAPTRVVWEEHIDKMPFVIRHALQRDTLHMSVDTVMRDKTVVGEGLSYQCEIAKENKL